MHAESSEHNIPAPLTISPVGVFKHEHRVACKLGPPIPVHGRVGAIHARGMRVINDGQRYMNNGATEFMNAHDQVRLVECK